MITKMSVRDGHVSLHVTAYGKLWCFDMDRDWTEDRAERWCYNLVAEIEVMEAKAKSLEDLTEKILAHLKTLKFKSPDKMQRTSQNNYEVLL